MGRKGKKIMNLLTKFKQYPLVAIAILSLIAIVICLTSASQSVDNSSSDHTTNLTLVFDSQAVIQHSAQRIVCSFASTSGKQKSIEAQIKHEAPAISEMTKSNLESCIFYANLGKIAGDVTSVSALLYNQANRIVGFSKFVISSNGESSTAFPKIYTLDKKDLHLESSTHLLSLHNTIKFRLEAVSEENDITANLTELVNFTTDTALLQPVKNAAVGSFKSIAYTNAQGTVASAIVPLAEGDFSISSSPVYITDKKLVSISLHLDKQKQVVSEDGSCTIPLNFAPTFSTDSKGAVPNFTILPKDIIKCSVNFNNSEIKNAEVIAEGPNFFVKVEPKKQTHSSDIAIETTFDAGALIGEHKMFNGLLKTQVD